MVLYISLLLTLTLTLTLTLKLTLILTPELQAVFHVILWLPPVPQLQPANRYHPSMTPQLWQVHQLPATGQEMT